MTLERSPKTIAKMISDRIHELMELAHQWLRNQRLDDWIPRLTQEDYEEILADYGLANEYYDLMAFINRDANWNDIKHHFTKIGY